MNNTVSVKTNFTSGQVAQKIYGRGDLSIYENGARKLQNVVVHPTGGVSRRRGLKFIDTLDGPARLVTFEFNTEQTYLLCFSNKKVRIYRNDTFLTELDSPWNYDQIKDFNWTQSADTLLIVHPDVPPKQLSRYNGELWKLEDWEYYSADGYVYCPYYNFYQHKENIKPSASSGNITLTADNPIFSDSYIGLRIKLNEGEGVVTGCTNSKVLTFSVTSPLSKSSATTDWEEQAFSPLRGWPRSVTFHQDRMVIGGSRDLPNRLWCSKSSDLFNFDLGTGLDDEAIEFAILSDQVNAVKAVVSARHLLVFTAGAEWMVSGSPLTPESIELHLQTKVGSYGKYYIPPQNIDGATTFISASGKQLREFLFADVEQAYQAKDLTLLSGDIIKKPIDCSFHPDESVLYIILEDGTISSLTTYRAESVNAWSKLKTQGEFISMTVIGEDNYFCIKRDNRYHLEKMTDDTWLDCCISLTSSQPKTIWNIPNMFDGKEVTIIADGFTIGNKKISNSTLELEEPASGLIIGYSYEHIIEPLPFMIEASFPYPPKALRIVQGIFRIIDSKSFCIDFGNGYFDVPLKKMHKDQILDAPSAAYNGDVELRSIGWVKDMEKPIWSVKDDTPAPFTMLSAVLELKIKN